MWGWWWWCEGGGHGHCTPKPAQPSRTSSPPNRGERAGLTAQHEEQHAGKGGHDHQQGQPDALPHSAGRLPPAPAGDGSNGGPSSQTTPRPGSRSAGLGRAPPAAVRARSALRRGTRGGRGPAGPSAGHPAARRLRRRGAEVRAKARRRLRGGGRASHRGPLPPVKGGGSSAAQPEGREEPRGPGLSRRRWQHRSRLVPPLHNQARRAAAERRGGPSSASW